MVLPRVDLRVALIGVCQWVTHSWLNNQFGMLQRHARGCLPHGIEPLAHMAHGVGFGKAVHHQRAAANAHCAVGFAQRKLPVNASSKGSLASSLSRSAAPRQKAVKGCGVTFHSGGVRVKGLGNELRYRALAAWVITAR